MFDVVYAGADVELSPAGLGLGLRFPRESIRLRLSGFTPAAVMVSTAALYWFVLVPYVFPRLRPRDADGAYARLNAGARATTSRSSSTGVAVARPRRRLSRQLFRDGAAVRARRASRLDRSR